jgi:hypothetical protein
MYALSSALTILGFSVLGAVGSEAAEVSGSDKPDISSEAWEQTGNLIAGGSFENELDDWQSPSFSKEIARGEWSTHDFNDYDLSPRCRHDRVGQCRVLQRYGA